MTEAGGLRQCLTDLARADTSGDYQKALQASNKLIRKYPKEICAFKCKLIALIQLAQYDEALLLIKKTQPGQMGECRFEKAYIEYRLGQSDEALNTLESASSEPRTLELKAQILYKLERFQEAYDLLRTLLKEHSDAFDEERKANFLAIQCQLEAQGVKQHVEEDWESWEQLYNASCHLIEIEQFPQALKKLDKALDLCRTSLAEEGLSEEDIEDDLAMIKVQRAFVLHREGRTREALEAYQQLHKTNCSDVSVKATVANNIPAASLDVNLPEARKKIKAALHLDLNKLTNRQRRTLMMNNALVLLQSNQREPCRRALDELSQKFGPSRDANLIEAALAARNNDTDKAVKVLEGNDDQLGLTCVHILVNNGKFAEALAAISHLDSKTRSRPAVASLVVALHCATGQKEEATKVLESTATSSRDDAVKHRALSEAAQMEADAQRPQKAAQLLEKLAELSPDDVTVQCRLLRAYSEYDPKKAEILSDKMFPSTSNEIVNVDELEESDWILYGDKYKMKKEQKMDVDDSEIITRKLKNRKRKRKIQLPKNYNPDVPPDPERWLPKQERAAYKKKVKKNRERDIGRGTQGSASANPNVEFTPASPNSPRTSAPVQEGPRQMRPAAAKHKKKR